MITCIGMATAGKVSAGDKHPEHFWNNKYRWPFERKRTNLWGRGSLQPIDGWQVKLWSKMWGDFHSTPPTGEVESTSWNSVCLFVCPSSLQYFQYMASKSSQNHVRAHISYIIVIADVILFPMVYNMWALTWFWDDLKALDWKQWSDYVRTNRQTEFQLVDSTRPIEKTARPKVFKGKPSCMGDPFQICNICLCCLPEDTCKAKKLSVQKVFFFFASQFLGRYSLWAIFIMTIYIITLGLLPIFVWKRESRGLHW